MLSSGTPLDLAIMATQNAPADLHVQQRFHAVLLRTTCFVPCLTPAEHDNDLTPLRLYHNDKAFFVAFDDPSKLAKWLGDAGDLKADISVKTLDVSDFIKALGQESYLVLNPGTSTYFEINPDHVAYLKKTIETVEHELDVHKTTLEAPWS